MINRLHGQPDSYDKKAAYKFGRTLGAGTYGIVREAEISGHKVAVKIILKKNVKGNESMVYDELKMLQSVSHPHIVRFVDWFESRVSDIQSKGWVMLTSSGQILYRNATSDRRRAVRSDL
jgi:calcium/calmodulin-dependent protein kinase I